MGDPVEGVDFANPRPDPAALVAAGKAFVVRYLSPNTAANPAKTLTPGELAGYRAAGLAVCVVWETTASRALAGATAGLTDARLAATRAHLLGFPADQPIYFAVDTDVDGPAVAGYFRGVAGVLGVARVGVYGGIKPVSYLFDHGLCTYGWQTYAWSAGRWDPRAQARQYRNGVRVAGIVCDLDRAMAADYGQWNPAGTTQDRGVTDMTTVDLTPAAVAAVVTALLTAKVDAVAVDEQNIPGLTVRGALRQSAARTAYLANQLAPALLGDEDQAAAAVAALKAELDGLIAAVAGLPAAVVAQLPAGGGVSLAQVQTAVETALAKLTLTLGG